MGMISYVISSRCFCWMWPWDWLVFELSVCVCDALNYLLPLLSNMVCNNLCDSDVSELLVKCCNMWCVMLNHVRSWFVCWLVEIPRDFVGLPELYGFKYDNLITSVIVLYLCSYNLGDTITAGIGAKFNIKHVICVFRNKRFYFLKLVLTTYSHI
jgi:hypothetical protein